MRNEDTLESKKNLFSLHKIIAKMPNNLDEAAPQLQALLTSLFQKSLSMKQSFKLLEHIHLRYGQSFQTIRQTIQRQTMAPWQPKATEAIDKLQQLLAVHYLHLCTQEQMNSDYSLYLSTLCKALFRSMTYLREIQLWYNQMYFPMPERLWFQIHYAYRQAFHFQIHEYRLSVFEDDLPHFSLEELYKSALLLSAANTPRLTPEEMVMLPAILDVWAKDVTLRENVNNVDLFGVCLLSDVGAQYQTIIRDKPELSFYRTLDTTPLILRLSTQQKLLSSLPEYLIKDLVRTLGSKPQRRHPRNQCAGTVILKSQQNPNEAITWQKQNSSISGYCLERATPGKIAVGETFVIEDLEQQQFHLATIRWIRHDKQAKQQVGIQFN